MSFHTHLYIHVRTLHSPPPPTPPQMPVNLPSRLFLIARITHLRLNDPLPLTPPTPQQITFIPHPRRPPTALQRYRWHRPTYFTFMHNLERSVRVGWFDIAGARFPDEFGIKVVEEGGGGGHATAEDGRGEFGGGP